MTLINLIEIGLTLVVAGWLMLIWRGISQNWLPKELKGATIAMVEKKLITVSPYPIVGRPDRVYRLSNGEYVPVENKNRDYHRVYETDIAQLSLQAWLLRQNNLPTSSFGYVVINSRKTRQRKSIRVDLYNNSVCARIIQRYIDLKEGRTYPHKSRGGKCKTCGHNQKCLL